MRRAALLPAALALWALAAGCPEEREGTRRQVPAGKVPPAMPVEALPVTAPADFPPITSAP